MLDNRLRTGERFEQRPEATSVPAGGAGASAMTAERFDTYMERCLYGFGGFYGGPGSAGRREGDFITSPEVGPLFGAVVAEAIDGWWDELGRPDPLPVYDVGCGPGTLLRTVALARGGTRLDRPWRLIGVDCSEAAGADRTDLPADLRGAVVVANELLDNLPFRIIEQTAAGPAEVYVVQADDGRRSVEELRPTDVELDIPVGTRAPHVEQAARWVADVLDRGAARLCVFDYGAPTTAELARRGGWLRTYRRHERGHDPLHEPGRWDITCDVPWDQLPPVEPERQADVLRRWGIERLVEEGRTYWNAHAHAPDLVALRMRSRVAEASALLDPAGLGHWYVGVWTQE